MDKPYLVKFLIKRYIKVNLISSDIRVILTLLVLILTTPVTAKQCNFLEQLSPYQREVANISYISGSAYDIGLTAVAIAWKESRLGIYKTRIGNNKYDISFGVGHTALYWKTKEMNSFEKGVWAQEMVQNDIKSISYMVQDLLYWLSRRDGDWRRMIESYNAGNGKNSNYVKDVVDTVNQIKNCKW